MTEAVVAHDYNMSDPGLPKGTTLCGGQFTITRRLSAGGFGITYLAEDTTLGRTVVIKECFPDDLCVRNGNNVIVRNNAQIKQFRSIVDMFMREARSIAKLRHPNIVGVHRAFEENDTAFMALDLIDGHDLLDILEANRNSLTPERIKDILVQLLEAVETIHNHDLLHRDISPDNIIIEKSGTPVLIDFGAARADASRRTRIVSSMLVVKDGYSPQEFYMAGSIQTPSSDLYALGATFYHVVSGEAPPNSQIRMAEIVGQNPDPCVPLAGRIEGYEPAFLEAIDNAMAILPDHRQQSAAHWRELITNTAPSVVPIAESITDAPVKPMTQDVERLLTRLIAETNEEVEKSKQELPEPAPAPVVEARKEERPDWLDEFNEESRNKAILADEDDAEFSEIEPAQRIEDVEAKDETYVEKEVANKTAPLPNTQIQMVRTRMATRRIQLEDAGVPAPPPDMTLRKQRELEKLEQERLAVIAEFRANSRIKSASLYPEDEVEVFGTTYERSRIISPLVKYLATGFVIGLGFIIMVPSLL